MADVIAKGKVGTAYADQLMDLNLYYEEQELSAGNQDWGIQGFVWKKVFDAGVAAIIGSPAGETQASGGGTVTPDQSDSGAGGIFGGGICTAAVTANTTRYEFLQCRGIGRQIMKTTGALAAGVFARWSGDDTCAAITAGTDDAEGFCWTLVAASGGSVAAGGVRLLI